MTYSNCRSCGAPIIWTRTWAGKAMPVDEEPIHGGNILVSPDGTATVIDGHLEMWPDEPRYVTASTSSSPMRESIWDPYP